MKWNLLIFDCDGVLVDSEPIANRIFAEQVVKLGFPMTPYEATRRFAGIQMSKAIDQVEELLGRSVPGDFETTFRSLSFEAFKHELQPVDGILDVLSKLVGNFCLASNGPRNKIELNLSLTGLDQYFGGRIFSAYELNVWKPDPEFYLKVAENMQVHPSECVVVEDTSFGATAAFEAGIRVLG
ncbi:MAG: HAD family hydrolase, partial [Saprospiraceae bacterium]|nr:HAD family hydrolase [Saprospiraceae bacterium]